MKFKYTSAEEAGEAGFFCLLIFSPVSGSHVEININLDIGTSAIHVDILTRV
jgi:hypothetical protein